MEYLRWGGVLADMEKRERVGVAALLILMGVAAILTSFSHVFNAVPPIYLSFLLPCTAIAAVLLGPLGAMSCGFVYGAVQYLHSLVMPLHYYELLLVNPVTSMGLLVLCGLLWGVLGGIALRNEGGPRRRALLLFLVSVVVSLVHTLVLATPALLADPNAPIAALSGATYNDILRGQIPTFWGLVGTAVLQVLISATYSAFVCEIAIRLGRRVRRLQGEIDLRMVSRITLGLVFYATLLVVLSSSFVSVSRRELRNAEEAMRSDVSYLCAQARSLDERTDAFERVIKTLAGQTDNVTIEMAADCRLLRDSLGEILNGYTMEQEGTVMIMSGDTLLMTDDERLPLYANVDKALGPDIMVAIDKSVATDEITLMLYHNALVEPGPSGRYAADVQLGYLLARREGAYTVVMIEPSDMVFDSRAGIIWREVLITIILASCTLAVIAKMIDLSIARRIDATNNALEQITEGNLEVRAPVEGTKEFKSLSSGINTTVDALNQWIIEAETRMDSELAAARAIQESTIPSTFPAFPEITNFDLFADMQTAREVGGDFYDFFLVGEDDRYDANRVVIVIADVSGKGIPAALLMMKAKTLIKEAVDRGMQLTDAFAFVNKELAEENDSFMFVTAWAGVLDYSTGHLEYVNAGHVKPLVCHDGSWMTLEEWSGLPIGMKKNVTYETFEYDLHPGDCILTCTDGVTEAMDENKQLFGDDRLMATVQELGTIEDPKQLVLDVYDAVHQFADANASHTDDITVLALTYKG